MRPDDFYTYTTQIEDDFGVFAPSSRRLNTTWLKHLRVKPLEEHEDSEVAPALARLVHDDLERFGTGGGEEMTDVQMRDALLALRATVDRLGVQGFDPPFRDFSTFKNYWVREGAAGGGGYRARRQLLANDFDSLHDQLADLETRALSNTLAEPISTHPRTGWAAVDTELSELRRHFQNARTAQDYRGVGNDCVHVCEALSREVYDPAIHLRVGEEEPPVSNTKIRLDRYIETALPGSENAALRKLARATIEMTQQVKHSTNPTRRDAGIAGDAVIQLANMLRRLAEPE